MSNTWFRSFTLHCFEKNNSILDILIARGTFALCVRGTCFTDVRVLYPCEKFPFLVFWFLNRSGHLKANRLIIVYLSSRWLLSAAGYVCSGEDD